MVNILVCSDTHGAVTPLLKLIGTVNPDFAIYLGDGFDDFNTARKAFSYIKTFSVRGNNDYNLEAPIECKEFISGKLFFITHGHMYNVKLTLKKLLTAGKKHGADIILYGHTHRPRVFYEKDMLLLNPGSLSRYVCSKPSYGIITIGKDGNVNAEIIPFNI